MVEEDLRQVALMERQRNFRILEGSRGHIRPTVLYGVWELPKSAYRQRQTVRMKGWSEGAMGSGEEEGLEWGRHGLPGAN